MRNDPVSFNVARLPNETVQIRHGQKGGPG